MNHKPMNKKLNDNNKNKYIFKLKALPWTLENQALKSCWIL
jgi:hypothetical protein